MTTIRAITTDALTRINAVGVGDTPDAAESANALGRLNAYMASWPSMGWVVKNASDADYTHTNLTLNDDWPLSSVHVNAITNILATMLAEQNGWPVGRQLAMDADIGLSMMQAEFFKLPTLTMPRRLKAYY